MDSTAADELWAALRALHYVYPALIFFYFVGALAITICTLQTQRLRKQDEHVRREIILVVIAAVALTYLAEAITIAIRAVMLNLDIEQNHMVYLITSTVVFGAQTLALTDSKFPVWYPYYGTWFIGLVTESCFLVLSSILNSRAGYFEYILISEQAFRVCAFIALPWLYFGLRNDSKTYDNFDAERQSLLKKKLGPKMAGSEESTLNGYGGTTDSSSQDSDTASNADSEDSWLARERKAKDAIEKRLKQDGNWFTYARGFAIFLPYLWPVHNKFLQFRAVLVGCCLLAGNALNLLVPIWLGIMVDSLTKYVAGDKQQNVWIPVVVYASLGFISGGACIGWIRRWLWMPIEQYSYDALSTASHAHIMSLSSDFHDSKTSSDLTQAISGGQSVFNLIETVLFQVIPMFIDLAVAFCYLWKIFGPYMGLVMASFAITYLYVTTKLYALRAEKRRDYIKIFRKEWTVGQQSLDGWNTASLFNMIPYERQRYAGAVTDHMKSKTDYEMSSQFISAVQSLVMTVGKMAVLGLGVWQIYHQRNTVGQFTTLIVYWAQLQSPLVFFSTMYRSISHSLMDAERLLELFQTKPTITDAPTAKPLELSEGHVKFNDVSFAYDDRKPTLRNVTFTVPAGKTVALVGETGGGKSTILKLIDRFYDVKGGSITIDGQDIRNVTMSSLREKIGVVPQDPMLFNDSIMNNIRYARLSATDAEVYEACKAAAVHDKIMSFPDGYNSKVGDRGVKLSGGEKQRVAIARAILKQPEIILLDEATSAVDTETEQIIQQGLNNLCRGRTTFIVAHRLSTIMKSDTILVVMNGKIIEEGCHDNLVRAGGKYHDLWSKQIFVTPSVKDRKKPDKDIINDITDSKTPMDLAKALGKSAEGDDKTKETSDSKLQNGARGEYVKEMGYGDEQPFTTNYEASSKCKAQSSTAEAKPDGETQGTPNSSQNGREGSTLKPDAPEFVPQQVDISSRNSSTKAIFKEAAKKKKKQEKEEKEEQKRLGKERKAVSLSKNTGKKTVEVVEFDDPSSAKSGFRRVSRPCNLPKHTGRVAGTDGAYSPEFSQCTEDPKAPEIIITAPGWDESTKCKRRRYSKRNASRSEPAGKSSNYSFHGSRDSEGSSGGSGEGQAAAPRIDPMRRVSAPSDPPERLKEKVTNRRRARHWRLKSRAVAARTSLLTDKQNSACWVMSSDDLAKTHPPLPAPA